MSTLACSLFGPLKIAINEAPASGFRYDKVRALLAYLMVESDRPHRRDTLIGLLWADLPEEAARTNLRQALTSLRSALGDREASPPYLLISRESVQWNAAAESDLDVAEFQGLIEACNHHNHRNPNFCKFCEQQLSRAVDLYRGDFLAQFFLPDSIPFEEWAIVKREAFQQQVLQALSQLISFLERRGEYQKAADYARRQLEISPWREETHRQLMRLLVLNNQRSEALMQYERCKRMLAEELGVTPDEITTTLYEQIRDQEDGSIELSLLAIQAERPHNLPPQLTPFLGREKELAQLQTLFDNPDCRLITLIGLGGIGKTRLAIQAATEQLESFADGVFFVDLSPLQQPLELAPALAKALDIPLTNLQDAQAEIVSYLKNKELLLVLDNFEHLLAGVSLLVDLLQSASQVALLVTSRERLGLNGEWLFEVGGLSLPQSETVGQNENSEALALFVQSVRRRNVDFQLSSQEALFAARTCCLLSGMPLAIELAAAWVPTLSCQEIVGEIEGNLQFLAAARPDLPERHHSLHAVLESTWEHLSPPEQQVLRRLAVFRGGFTRQDAEHVAGASLPIIKGLIEKSLVQRSPSGRYDLHRLVQLYALKQLESSGEAEDIHGLHLRYFCQFAQDTVRFLQTEEAASWLRSLEEQRDNFYAALKWALENGEIETGLELAVALYRFWYWRSYFAEGVHWLEAFLANIETSQPQPAVKTKAAAYFVSGVLNSILKDLPLATMQLRTSLELYDAMEDKAGQADCFNSLGAVAFEMEDYAKAEELFESSLKLHRELGEVGKVSNQLSNLGTIALTLNDIEKARVFFEESLEIDRQVKNQGGIAIGLSNLAWISQAQGDLSTAKSLYLESLHMRNELEDREGIMYSLEGLAGVAATDASEESAALAARLLGAAQAIQDLLNLKRSNLESSTLEAARQSVIRSLGYDTFIRFFEEGKTLDIQSSIALVNENR